MLGLIKKDLLLIKGNLKAVGMIFIIIIGMAFFQEANLAFVPSFVSTILFMSTFSYDEYNKWDSYAITLPNGRKNIVGAKYITTFILLFISTLLAIILSTGIGIVRNEFHIGETLITMAGSIFATVLLVSIIYPIIFKFGNEKGRIAMFIIAFLGASLFAFLLKSLTISEDVIEHYGFIFLVIVSIITLLGSYLLSKHIYRKKEF